MKLKIITVALSACLLANIAPGFADTKSPINLPLFSAFQHGCSLDDVYINKNTAKQNPVVCTWKETSDHDSGMQTTLHFEDKLVKSVEADCTFTPAEGSSDKIKAVLGYKHAAGNLENIQLGSGTPQHITFKISNPGTSDNANIVFLTTALIKKAYYDNKGTSYTAGDSMSCTFTNN